MQERVSGGHAYGIFFVVALLFSSGLVVPLSGYSSSSSQQSFLMTIGQGPPGVITAATLNVDTATPASLGAPQMPPLLSQPAIITNSAPLQRSAANPFAELGMALEGVMGPVIGVPTTGQGLTVSAPASGGAGFTTQQVIGEYSTTGGEVIATSNGMIFAPGNILVSGQQGFITVSGQVPVQPRLNIGSISTLSSVTSAIPGLWMDASKRRSRSQIYVEILELMKRGPMTPFEIAFYARLNHKRTKEYIEFLKRSGYLEAMQEDGRSTLVLTKNGLSFLERARALFQENPPSTQVTNVDYQWQSS